MTETEVDAMVWDAGLLLLLGFVLLWIFGAWDTFREKRKRRRGRIMDMSRTEHNGHPCRAPFCTGIVVVHVANMSGIPDGYYCAEHNPARKATQ